MAWFAVYECATGRLVTQGSQVSISRLRSSWCVKEFVNRPAGSSVWDGATLDYVARPVEATVDRWDDLLVDANFAAVFNSLSAGDQTDVRTPILRIFGTKRFRQASEPAAIED